MNSDKVRSIDCYEDNLDFAFPIIAADTKDTHSIVGHIYEGHAFLTVQGNENE